MTVSPGTLPIDVPPATGVVSALRHLFHLGMVLVLFSATTAFVFSEWWLTVGSALIGPPEDNMQDLWNSWYGAFADHPDGSFYTKLIRYPEGTSLLYHSFAYPKVFAVALATKWLGLDASHLITLHNLGLLISFPIAGTGAFLLLRHFAVNTGGALLGGYIFAFNPSHIEHVMHHAHVSSIELIPFFILAYLRALRRKSYRWVPAAVVLYALNARIAAKSGKAKWLVSALAILIVLDFFPGRPLQTTPLVCAPGLSVIKDDPDRNFGVLDLPSGYYSANLYMFQQTCHGRPIVEGNTSRKLTASLRDRLEMNDLQVQRRQLTEAKVKYIIVNRHPMGIPVAWEPADGTQEALLAFYSVAHDSAEMAILRVY